jgi:hypothetical protein
MRHKSIAKRTGCILIAAALLLPLATNIGAHLWLQSLASMDPVPNQGAMVLAGLVLRGTQVIGAILLLVGLGVLARAWMVRS